MSDIQPITIHIYMQTITSILHYLKLLENLRFT
jgi:hypothetical protein